MKIIYNAADRKTLVQAISEFTGCKAVYMKTPTYAYRIDYFTVTREGNLEFDDMADSEEIENLIEVLAEKGFVAESSAYDSEQQTPEICEEEPIEDCPPDYLTPSENEPQGETVGLTVAIPLDKVAVGNLTNLLDAKGSLIKKALGIPATPIEIGEDRISFPWFGEGLDADEVKAYSHFIAALCEMSRNQKRINATEKAVDNEKYAFRCFLLHLGFIGNEYKTERKILLRNLSGSSAFKAPKTEKTYRVELDDDNFKIFTATNSAEAERIGADIAEELGSGYCLVEEVAE